MTSAEVTRQFWEGAEASPDIQNLKAALVPAQSRVLDHPLYGQLETIEDLITFTELHVFAVWDFMSLLKALQRRFTCVQVPWRPIGGAVARRLINEIVLIEETDTIGMEYMSHFELYLAAMDDLGADTKPVRRFVQLLSEDVPVSEALDIAGAPTAAATFVRNTWRVVTEAPIHGVAAAFALTREDLIPEMFDRVLNSDAIEAGRLDRFTEYLRRHIQVDAEEHTPMAMELLWELCGTDEVKWEECRSIAEECFDSRSALWTGVCQLLAANRATPDKAAAPAAAVAPAAERIVIRLAFPGTERAEELELTVADDILSVRNRRTGHRCDLSVACGLDPTKIAARFDGSNLEVSLPAAGEEPAGPVHVVPVTAA